MMNFTNRIKKAMAMAAFTLVGCISTFAATDEYYYWFYDAVEAYPTGKGTVYATFDTEEEPSDADYKDYIEVKYYQQGSSYVSLLGYAKPAEGYLFAGWSEDRDDVIDSIVFSSYEIPAYLSVNTLMQNEDELTPAYNFVPDTTFRAIFAKVGVGLYDEIDQQLGSAEISNVCNDKGESLTIIATPNELFNAKFEYWTIEGTDTKITENPYELTAGDNAERYLAHFSSEYVKEVEIPESGYLLYSNNNYWSRIYDGEALYIGEFNTMDPENNSIVPIDYYGMDRATGYLLTSESPKVTILIDPTTAENAPDEYSYLKPGPMDLSEAKDGVNYYVFNPTDVTFIKATEGNIPEGSTYLEMPVTSGLVGDIIYIDGYSKNIPEGVETVKIGKINGESNIFDLNGRKQNKLSKGINIVNGKKVYISK